MSAVAAILQRDGQPVDTSVLHQMLTTVPYRGPDGTSVAELGIAALGQAKMAVTPEEEDEQQPLMSSRTGCVIVADARLDNREVLLSRLPDRQPRTASDAELILRAYEAWGEGCFTQLLGDFAFMIWDPRVQQLLGARDTSGQRCLYYTVDQHRCTFASQIHQLLKNPSVSLVPNERQIQAYLSPLVILDSERDQGPETFFEGIYAIPAGHALRVDASGLRVWRYWELDPPDELRYRDAGKYAEHFRTLFSEVVGARLRSSRPPGALLSGGLDSSSIVCMAHELYRTGQVQDHGFIAYFLVFEDLNHDEREYVRDIRAKYGVELRELPVTAPIDFLQLEPRGLPVTPLAIRMRILENAYRAASQDGVRALLTGDMADAFVRGSPHVLDSLLRQGKFGEFWSHFQACRGQSGSSVKSILGLSVIAPLLPFAAQKSLMAIHVRRQFGGKQRHQFLPPWLAPPVREELANQILTGLLEIEQKRRFHNPTRQEMYDAIYPPEAALHPVPWPLDVWRPYADRRLHEFFLSVPPEQLWTTTPDRDTGYAATKWLVRRGMQGILPDRIRLRRTKTTFSSVLRQEIVQRWSTYEAVFGPSGQSHLQARGYLDQPRFWRRLQMFRDGVNGADNRYLNQVVGLETWLRAVARAGSGAVPTRTLARPSVRVPTSV